MTFRITKIVTLLVAGVLAHFRLGMHPDADQVEVGMLDDRAQREMADKAGAELRDAVFHRCGPPSLAVDVTDGAALSMGHPGERVMAGRAQGRTAAISHRR